MKSLQERWEEFVTDYCIDHPCHPDDDRPDIFPIFVEQENLTDEEADNIHI